MTNYDCELVYHLVRDQAVWFVGLLRFQHHTEFDPGARLRVYQLSTLLRIPNKLDSHRYPDIGCAVRNLPPVAFGEEERGSPAF